MNRIAWTESFWASPSGIGASRELSDHIDSQLFAAFSAISSERDDLALVAVGGYGRQEQSPYSDVDIAIFPGSADDGVIRNLHHELHRVAKELGIELDYSYRVASDLPGLDLVTKTGLMESRLIAGSSALFQAFMEEYWSAFPTGDFILNRLEERNFVRAKTHDTPLVTQPNLKEGAGGLRCYHCANWIRRALGEPPLEQTDSLDTVLKVRNALHVAAGKRHERLTPGFQATIAESLGLQVRELMAQLHEAMLINNDEFQRTVQLIKHVSYTLRPGVFAKQGAVEVTSEATLSNAAFGISMAHQLGLEMPQGRIESSSFVSGEQVIRALGQGSQTIRALDHCGLLERILPELTACRTFLPDDLTHYYTVYEHTLKVVENLEEPSEFVSGLLSQIPDPHLLILAALLHDVGKAVPDLPHSEAGAELTRARLIALKIEEQSIEYVEWLVANHLLLARALRLHDISRPEIIEELSNCVGSALRLRALTALTWADSAAVSDSSWSTFDDSLLRELYARILGRLESPESSRSAESLRRAVAKELPEPVLQAFVSSLPGNYLFSARAELIPLHYALVESAQSGAVAVDFRHDQERGVTELTLAAQDAPGLLWRILGVLYAHGLSINSVHALSTRAPNPIALDTFTVNYQGASIPGATAAMVRDSLTRCCQSSEDVDALLIAHRQDPYRIETPHSYVIKEGSPMTIEVRSQRGRGLAYRLARQIHNQGLNVISARIGQWAGQGAATFYVTDPNQTLVP